VIKFLQKKDGTAAEAAVVAMFGDQE